MRGHVSRRSRILVSGAFLLVIAALVAVIVREIWCGGTAVEPTSEVVQSEASSSEGEARHAATDIIGNEVQASVVSTRDENCISGEVLFRETRQPVAHGVLITVDALGREHRIELDADGRFSGIRSDVVRSAAVLVQGACLTVSQEGVLSGEPGTTSLTLLVPTPWIVRGVVVDSHEDVAASKIQVWLTYYDATGRSSRQRTFPGKGGTYEFLAPGLTRGMITAAHVDNSSPETPEPQDGVDALRGATLTREGGRERNTMLESNAYPDYCCSQRVNLDASAMCFPDVSRLNLSMMSGSPVTLDAIRFQQLGEVSISVLSGRTGNALEGAAVTWPCEYRNSVVVAMPTDGNGKTQMFLPAGKYASRFQVRGFDTVIQTETLEIVSGSVVAVDLVALNPTTANTISVQCIRSNDSSPIAGITVVAGVQSAVTDDAGWTRLRSGALAESVEAVFADRCKASIDSMEYLRPDVLRIRVATNRKVSIRVLDASGMAIESAGVLLEYASPGVCNMWAASECVQVAAVDGVISFEYVDDSRSAMGALLITESADGMQVGWVSGEELRLGHSTLVVHLCRLQVVTGKIVRETGQTARSVRLWSTLRGAPIEALRLGIRNADGIRGYTVVGINGEFSVLAPVGNGAIYCQDDFVRCIIEYLSLSEVPVLIVLD